MRQNKMNVDHMRSRANTEDYDAEFRLDKSRPKKFMRKGLPHAAGVSVDFSCPQCSYEETVEFVWPEIMSMLKGNPFPVPRGMGLRKLPTGWIVSMLCKYCSKEYRGQRPKEAIIDEMIVTRTIEVSDLHDWLAYAKQKGFVR